MSAPPVKTLPAKEIRRSLRDGLRHRIGEQICNGKLAPGQRINLASLARTTGVSPTPLREALSQLQQEGLIRAEPNRGFFVPDYSAEHMLEAYPILAVLEGLAVQSIKYAPRTIRGLRAANRRLRDSDSDPFEAFAADMLWHTRLVEPCTNTTLLAELIRLRQRIASSELAFMREAGNRPESVADHENVTCLLEGGDRRQAVQALQAHWDRSVLFIRVQEDNPP